MTGPGTWFRVSASSCAADSVSLMKVPGSKHAGSPTLQETQRESGISSVSSTLQENVVFTQSGSLTWSFLRITGYIPNRPHLGTYSELLVFLNHSLSLSYVSLVYLFECCFSEVNMYFTISTEIPPTADCRSYPRPRLIPCSPHPG